VESLTLFDDWQEIGEAHADGAFRAYLSVGEFRLGAETADGVVCLYPGLEGNVLDADAALRS